MNLKELHNRLGELIDEGKGDLPCFIAPPYSVRYYRIEDVNYMEDGLLYPEGVYLDTLSKYVKDLM